MTWIALQGACNARDLGGLPTVDGRTTRHGVLLRSDNLQDLTAQDVEQLLHAGVGTVVDLRTSAEVEITGPGPLTRTEVVHVNLDLVPHGFDGREDLVERTIPDEDAGEHAMDHFYIDYVNHAPDAIAAGIRTIADPKAGAVLVHCAAGKDRTGVLIGVVLSLVGVKREAVVADYARSAERVQDIRDRLMATELYSTNLMDRSIDSMTSRTENMERFLDRVDRDYGGAHGLAMSIGVDEETIDRLRRRLLVTKGLPVVGMVGGGQLSRMTHQAAISLGLSLRVLADATHDSAALVAQGVTVGSHTSLDDLTAFAQECEVVTFDHEHVPGELIAALEAKGLNVQPGSRALLHAQDKQVMRERLRDLGIAVPPFAVITSAQELEAFAAEHGWPVVLKAATGGYDGKGVWVVESADQAAAVIGSGVRLLAEQRVELRRELAAVVARSPYGQAAAWPVVETVQRDGICVEVIAPATGLSEELAVQAQGLALRLAEELGVVGVLAVELFETAEGLLVNELAMRPHNSGHWTIEGSRTSQFEQHLRAVLDYPLGATTMTAPVVVMANVLGGDGEADLDRRLHLLMARDPALKVHLYGKEVRPGRKIGHVTALGDDVGEVRTRARTGADYLRTGEWLHE